MNTAFILGRPGHQVKWRPGMQAKGRADNGALKKQKRCDRRIEGNASVILIGTTSVPKG
jgi:hypothetical protein